MSSMRGILRCVSKKKPGAGLAELPVCVHQNVERIGMYDLKAVSSTIDFISRNKGIPEVGTVRNRCSKPVAMSVTPCSRSTTF